MYICSLSGIDLAWYEVGIKKLFFPFAYSVDPTLLIKIFIYYTIFFFTQF